MKKNLLFCIALLVMCCFFIGCPLEEKFPHEMTATLKYDETRMTVYNGWYDSTDPYSNIINSGSQIDGNTTLCVILKDLAETDTINTVLYNNKDVTNSILIEARENYSLSMYSDDKESSSQLYFDVGWSDYCYSLFDTKFLKDKGTLTISYTTRQKEQVTLNFNENISFSDETNYESITSGSAITEGSVLYFNHIGMMIQYDRTTVLDYFLLNNQKVTEGEMNWKIPYHYYVHKKDAENGVLDIQAITRAAKEIKINFDATRIKCLKTLYTSDESGSQEATGTEEIASGTTVLETNDVNFTYELPESQTFKMWRVSVDDTLSIGGETVSLRDLLSSNMDGGTIPEELTVILDTQERKKYVLLNYCVNPDYTNQLEDYITAYKDHYITGDPVYITDSVPIYEGDRITLKLDKDKMAEDGITLDMFLGWNLYKLKNNKPDITREETYEEYVFNARDGLVGVTVAGVGNCIRFDASFVEPTEYRILFDENKFEVFYIVENVGTTYVDNDTEIANDKTYILRPKGNLPEGKTYCYLINNKKIDSVEVTPEVLYNCATEDKIIAIDYTFVDATY